MDDPMDADPALVDVEYTATRFTVDEVPMETLRSLVVTPSDQWLK